MRDKNSWMKIAAIAAGIVGIVVVVAVFIKNRAKYLNEELDFDSDAYFDDDEDDALDRGYVDTEETMDEKISEDDEQNSAKD